MPTQQVRGEVRSCAWYSARWSPRVWAGASRPELGNTEQVTTELDTLLANTAFQATSCRPGTPVAGRPKVAPNRRRSARRLEPRRWARPSQPWTAGETPDHTGADAPATRPSTSSRRAARPAPARAPPFRLARPMALFRTREVIGEPHPARPSRRRRARARPADAGNGHLHARLPEALRRRPRDALIRLVGAVLAERHDEWTKGRRYLGLDVLTRASISSVPDPEASAEEAPAQSPHAPPSRASPHARRRASAGHVGVGAPAGGAPSCAVDTFVPVPATVAADRGSEARRARVHHLHELTEVLTAAGW
jgi:hypothetical protein